MSGKHLPLNDANGTYVEGNVAAATTDAGNPVKVGGVYRSSGTQNLSNLQRGDLSLTSKGELRVFLTDGTNGAGIVATNDSLTTAGNSLLVSAPAFVYNPTSGSFERLRTAVIYKAVSIAVTAGSPVTVWTPAAGKKLRLMGWCISPVTTGAAFIFYDGGVATGIRVANEGSSRHSNNPPGMLNGYLSSAANNTLTVDASANCTLDGFFFGTEE